MCLWRPQVDGTQRGVWDSVTLGLHAQVSGGRHALFWVCPSAPEPVASVCATAVLSYPVCPLLIPAQTRGHQCDPPHVAPPWFLEPGATLEAGTLSEWVLSSSEN